jgi:hypothetical protein
VLWEKPDLVRVKIRLTVLSDPRRRWKVQGRKKVSNIAVVAMVEVKHRLPGVR